MTLGGDLRRPALPPEAARELAAAPDHEGHERTGVTVYVALHDRTDAPGVPAPQAVLDDGARVAAALEQWHAGLGGDDVQVTSTALATWEMRTAAPVRDPSWTPFVLGADPSAPSLGEVTAAFVAGRLLRVVNFHSTPARLAARVEAELLDYATRYTPVSAADLGAALDGRWPASVAERPPVVLAFFDGFANHAQVAAPVLDELGVPGWFHLVTGFLDAAPGDQPEFARRHVIRVAPEELERGSRLALTWDEVAQLAERHEVGAHTATHATAAAVRTADELEREVRAPLRRVREVIGRPPATTAWLGGTRFDASHPGDRAALDAGVAFHVAGLGYERLTR
jgi:peptidoglycan/xylan/chitin deacetylase (PgdA/CDA1 family)